MNILLCPDKFKGSLSAAEVCASLREGLLQAYPDAHIRACPLADGGDGSLSVLSQYREVEAVAVETTDPLGRSLQARYLRAGDTAYVELAAASGLVLLKPEDRNPLTTTSLGTGNLIRHAVEQGAQQLYLFIGGSATNDAGIGIAHALGYRFRDAQGRILAPTGENLVHIHHIDETQRLFEPGSLVLKVICDVDNPLYGPNGAAYVYAPQKGASPAVVEQLDRGLKQLSERCIAQGYADVGALPGAGAAGGIGGGAVALLGARLHAGTDTFLEISRLASHIQWADWVITGEGHLDQQTVHGKLISGICRLAREAQKPIIGVCGAAEQGVADALGMQRVYSVLDRARSLEEAMVHAAEKVRDIGASL